MNSRSLRLWTVLFPIVSVLASGSIVAHQYWRRASLAAETVTTEREIARLEKLLPHNVSAPAHHHTDDD